MNFQKRFGLSIVTAVLLVTTYTGCGENTKDGIIQEAQKIEVKDDASKVLAKTRKVTIDEGEALTFKAETNKEYVRYEWHDGSGKLLTTQKEYNRLFPQEGEYTTKLTAIDADGKIDVSLITVKVNRAPVEVIEDNIAPVVQVQVNKSDILSGEQVLFDSVGTTDEDGSIVSYAWRDMDNILLSSKPSFKRALYYFPQYDFLKNGTTIYKKTLTVTDDKGAKAHKTAMITVHKTANIKPIADAGDNVSVLEGASVTLNADASRDSDGSIVSYRWEEGNTLLGIKSILQKNDFPVGEHTIKLSVTDNEGATDTDTVLVTVDPKIVQNQPPVAKIASAEGIAFDTRTVPEGHQVVINADNSKDSDGQISSYEWKDGTDVIGSASLMSKVFSVGVHTITLTVTDDQGLTGTDTVIITVEGANETPVANAGADVEMTLGNSTIITLDGSASYDPDDDVLSYEWKIIQKPQNSMIESELITSRTASGMAYFAPDKAGEYKVALTVNDGSTNSDPDVVNIIVLESPNDVYAIYNPEMVVIDKDSGLMWQNNMIYRYTWDVENKEPVDYENSQVEYHYPANATIVDVCEGLIFAGYSDWRAPTIAELEALNEKYKIDPVYKDILDNKTEYLGHKTIWSSTESLDDPTEAWVTHMGNRTSLLYPKSRTIHLVCVRNNTE